MKKKISIIGATGYTGGELMRYLLRIPEVRVTHVTSESSPGKKLSTFHSDLAGKTDLVTERNVVSSVAKDSDLVFLCLPHAESAQAAKNYLDAGLKVIDLSADFRLKDASVYEQWYKVKHPCPSLLKSAVYGLPEVYRERIKKAKLIANPGCYTTTSILSALPLARKKLAGSSGLVIDAKSGVSGAGRKVESRYIFGETHENFLAYSVGGHRHLPEIEQELGLNAVFVPHLLPVHRGILATVYADLTKKISAKDLREIYAEFYKDEPFVVVLEEGKFPELKSVANTNFCHIGVGTDFRGKKAVVIGAIDNLGKGASGQAVQNMNLLFGWDEKTGLI